MLVKTLAAAALIASLTGCSGTTSTASVSAQTDLRRAIGTALPGTRGLTAADQNAIDDTVAGSCAIGLYRPDECRRHNGVAR